MNRRDLIRAGLGAAALPALAACQKSDCAPGGAAAGDTRKRTWKMVTTWPRDFPGLGTGANYLAEQITAMSGGRLTVKVYGAGELVPAFEVFDTVSAGTAEIGHGAAYYWKGKVPAAQFFTTVPFGFTAQEMAGWLAFGGGMTLWEELYKPFNILPFDAGNTTVQMAGWFNREITTVDDLKGLKMRIPGLGGEVLRRLGVTVQNIPGGELFQALSEGTIDATEWVGPYNDLAFGLHQAARYCYYPGWHEPGPVLEAIVNRDAFAELPPDLQTIVRVAAEATSRHMVAEYTARSGRALATLVQEHGVKVRPLPEAVLDAIRQTANEVVAELGETDAQAAAIYASYRVYLDDVVSWTRISEQAYLNARG